MKILYIHNIPIGSEKANVIQVLSMCCAFVDNDITIDLVLPEPTINSEDVSGYIEEKFGITVKFNLIFYKPIFKNSKLQKYFGDKSIKEIVLNNDADFVFTRLPSLVNIALASGKKLIFESHNNLLHNRISIIDYFWKFRLLKAIKNNNFVLFICISHNLKKFWKQLGITNEKLLTLHDGFSSQLFNRLENRTISRNKLGISLKSRIAMYIGSLYPDREIEKIINVAQKVPEFEYYIIGGPEKYRKYYWEMTNDLSLKNVKILGHIPYKKVPKYLASADILLALWSNKVPTMNFCSPLKIFEYMASGRIILAHSFITIKEVLEDNVDSLLVDPNREDDLARKLELISGNSNMEFLAKNARKKAIKNYSWNSRVRKIISQISSTN